MWGSTATWYHKGAALLLGVSHDCLHPRSALSICTPGRSTFKRTCLGPSPQTTIIILLFPRPRTPSTTSASSVFYLAQPT